MNACTVCLPRHIPGRLCILLCVFLVFFSCISLFVVVVISIIPVGVHLYWLFFCTDSVWLHLRDIVS